MFTIKFISVAYNQGTVTKIIINYNLYSLIISLFHRQQADAIWDL